MNSKYQIENVTKTAKNTEYTLKLLTNDVGKANKIMIDNAIEKALVEFDKQMTANLKVIKESIGEMKIPVDQKFNDLK